MARQGNTTAIGMGWPFQRDRKRAMAALRDGTPCDLCGRPMFREAARNWDGRVLNYDHIVPRALGGAHGPCRLVHQTCNVRAGSAVRKQLRRAQAPRRAVYDRW